MDPTDLVFLLAGLAALLAGLLPRLLEGRPLSLPIAFLGLGMLVFAFPSQLPVPDPLQYPGVTEHLAEVCVIVALMGAGLKLDRPLGWRRWAVTWRLLAVMPTEVAGGYGFLAVFLCACSIRAAERTHSYQQVLHDFTEQIERLLTVLLLVLLGGAVVGGLLIPLTWEAAALGLALLVLIRPLTAWVSLTHTPIAAAQRGVIAVFGIRGIGSLYYMAYAASAAAFPGVELLWAIVGFVVVVSVVF